MIRSPKPDFVNDTTDDSGRRVLRWIMVALCALPVLALFLAAIIKFH